jgi:hypothetical protein
MRIILVDTRISDSTERSLLKLGLDPIKLPPDRSLGEAVKSHPDTLLFCHKDNIITTADYCDDAAYIFSDIREYRPHIKISFTSDVRAERYPMDAVMNGLVIGDILFCNTKNISPAIKDYALSTGLSLVHTNQGYPACTVLSFSNRAITHDRGMADILEKNGIKTLLIRQGHISLPPHEYGFIGGASFVYGNRVCFFGNLDAHPDGARMRDFIQDGGFEVLSLSDEPLSDFGGAVIL